jgi:hypothetical protein
LNKKYTEFNEQVALGEQICVKLKHIYYPETTGFDSYRAVAEKLTELKKKARLVLTHMTEVEILKQLRNFTTEDIKELMDDSEKAAVQGK